MWRWRSNHDGVAAQGPGPRHSIRHARRHSKRIRAGTAALHRYAVVGTQSDEFDSNDRVSEHWFGLLNVRLFQPRGSAARFVLPVIFALAAPPQEPWRSARRRPADVAEVVAEPSERDGLAGATTISVAQGRPGLRR